MISACTVVMELKKLRIDELQAGLEQLGADHQRHGAADQEHDQANTRYIVPMSLWLVVNSQRPMPFAGPWSSW